MAFRKVRRTALAENDLIDIWLYIAVENPGAADRLLDRIELRTQLLATQPFSGVARDDLGSDLREVVIGNYIVFYRLEEDGIVVLRVLHGKRDLTAKEFDD